MPQSNLAANQNRFHKVFRAIHARHLAEHPQPAPPPNATVVRVARLQCRFPDGTEACEVRGIRAWCAKHLRELVYVEWQFDDGFFTPVAHCADQINAVELTLRWV